MIQKIASISVLALAFTATANLLINGNFDDATSPVLTGTNSGVFDSIPGWNLTSGYGIEVQRNSVVQAHSRNQYVQLNSAPTQGNSGMEQSVYLTKGWYEFDFYYQPRTGDDDDNGISYGIDGLHNCSVDATTATWSGC